MKKIERYNRWWIGTILLILWGLQMQAQAGLSLYSCYDAHFYELELKLNADTRRIAGTALFHAQMTQESDRLAFDLGEPMTIVRIQMDGRRLRFQRSGTTVIVELGQRLSRGSLAHFSILFAGYPESEASPMLFAKDGKGRIQIQFDSQKIDPEAWHPIKLQVEDPVDSSRIEVIYEKGPQVIATGEMVYQVDEPGEFQRSVFVHRQAILPAQLELHIGYFEKLTEVYHNDAGYHELEYYVESGQGDAGKQRLKEIQAAISCLEAYFGPYPFSATEMMWVNPEKKTTQVSEDVYGVDVDLVRELAKQWWGKTIQAELAEDAWIPQAFETYAASLVIECQTDSRQALAFLKNLEASEKHAMILHTLRSITDNEEQWFGACRALPSTFSDRPISNENLLDFLQWKLNIDASLIFQQYLLHPSPPVLEYTILSKNKKLTFAYRWNTPFKAFDMPVDVLLKGTRERITPTTEWQTRTWRGASRKHLEIDKDFGWFEMIELEL